MDQTRNDLVGKLSGAVSSGELLRWTEDMVRLPSWTSAPGRERGVAEYIAALLNAEGIEAETAPLGGGCWNCVARLPGTGGGKSLLLCGHMDTVPDYGWKKACEPWLADGHTLRGRGVSDMKGPLAAMLGSMIALKRAGIALAGDLIFAGVADEEEGSIGARALLDSGLRADAAIVGEAMGRGCVAVGQKGLEWYSFRFIGRTVHGGKKALGINAISKAVKFINAVENELEPRLDARVHPLLGPSTVNIGVINGGTQLSTVAGECTVLLDRRFLPQEGYEGMPTVIYGPGDMESCHSDREYLDIRQLPECSLAYALTAIYHCR